MLRQRISLVLLVLLTGCSVGPVYQEPLLNIPCEWSEGVDTACTEEEIETAWWKRLNDPILDELMDIAVQHNLDLQIAAIRLLQARTEANAKKGDLYPRIDGSANAGHVYYSKNGLVNGLLGTACPTKSHVKRNVDFFEVGFDAEWELDLWGMTAHEIAALKAHEEAVQEVLCGVWVSLSAEIAKNYVELRGLQHQLKLAEQKAEIQEFKINLNQELLSRGFLNESEYSRSKAELSALKGEVPLIYHAIKQKIYHLSILLSYNPSDLEECLCQVQEIPEVPCTVSFGVPSELLRRRPDIKRAERELAAATEKIGSAIAGLFPRFSLQGFIGDISTHAGSLFKPASAAWFAGPTLLVPIFNSRLLLREVEYSKLVTQEAIYTYQKTVLEALEECESAILLFKLQQERGRHLSEALKESKIALQGSLELYERGLIDNFAVSDAKNFNATTELSLIQSQVDRLLSYIALYKSLGGSWLGACTPCDKNEIL